MPADKQPGTAYLQKPFTSADLLAKVKHVLARKSPVD
jgi:DNA-binding response OmpR family regulator